jgi:hypothetical protein
MRRNLPREGPSIAGWARALAASTSLALLAATAAAADSYRRAEILENGRLRIVTADGKKILPKKRRDQVGFDKVAVSENGRAVGWLALYPNCCTSYPIPLELVILANGRGRKLTGNGLPIWRWQFTAGGKHVAFEQETVHGGLGIHYELRDVASGRRVAQYGPDAASSAEKPGWVRDLDAAQ